jgi:hypothetical protein
LVTAADYVVDGGFIDVWPAKKEARRRENLAVVTFLSLLEA